MTYVAYVLGCVASGYIGYTFEPQIKYLVSLLREKKAQ